MKKEDLIIGIIATLWGIGIVVRVTFKSIDLLNSEVALNSHNIGFLLGGVLGLALTAWGIMKIKSWKNSK